MNRSKFLALVAGCLVVKLIAGVPSPTFAGYATPAVVGVSLSDEFQLPPEQSTSAIVTLNPHAKYFSV